MKNQKQPDFIDIIVLLKLWALETLSLCKSKHWTSSFTWQHKVKTPNLQTNNLQSCFISALLMLGEDLMHEVETC